MRDMQDKKRGKNGKQMIETIREIMGTMFMPVDRLKTTD